jgi:hypothetical protein
MMCHGKADRTKKRRNNQYRSMPINASPGMHDAESITLNQRKTQEMRMNLSLR